MSRVGYTTVPECCLVFDTPLGLFGNRVEPAADHLYDGVRFTCCVVSKLVMNLVKFVWLG